MSLKKIPSFLAPVALAAIPFSVHADWGAYVIVPSSARNMVLETVDAGKAPGSIVSVNRPDGGQHQKWMVVPKEDGFVSIRPLHEPSLVLSIGKGLERNGSQAVLEEDTGSPWQLWSTVRHEDGSYSLLSKHVAGKGLDHFAGKAEPGARVDLWEYKPGDGHLRWFIRPIVGSGMADDVPSEGEPSYVPPAIEPDAIPKGQTKEFTFTQSKVFPGTTRRVTVFIPAQYDGSKPACVYVKTDGFNPREQTLLETMMATKEIPVMVGVFVRPGDLPATVRGTAGRRNRCFEYDAVNDNNVRFFDEELLPYVAKEYGLNLSTDGNDRCISGGSSGGIAAFTAAWNRPEAFNKVYAASGSWVAFRGGHEFPTMVRKFEARPIRSYLTTATHDMENAAGDWYLLDQEMDKALKFSGYDYQFRTIEGRHVQGYGENWREAMAYLWRDWPERIQPGPSAPRAQEILITGEGWELVADGFKSTRGPSTNASGEVYFADTSRNQVFKIGTDGKVVPFVADSGKAHCVSVGPDGTVYTISEISGDLMAYDPAGYGRKLMEGLPGHSIFATPGGGLYVTSNGDKPHGPGTVWYVKDGQKTKVGSGIKFATGMAMRPDQWLLSVAEGHSKWVYSYQIQEDGGLTNRERFFHLHVADWDDDAGAESVCYSIEGRQFVATRSGIQISADDGPTQVILPVPERSRVTGVAIGGSDKDTLFAFCMDRIWKRKILQHAMGSWSEWAKVTPNRL
jgi:gluconolactonase